VKKFATSNGQKHLKLSDIVEKNPSHSKCLYYLSIPLIKCHKNFITSFSKSLRQDSMVRSSKKTTKIVEIFGEHSSRGSLESFSKKNGLGPLTPKGF